MMNVIQNHTVLDDIDYIYVTLAQTIGSTVLHYYAVLSTSPSQAFVALPVEMEPHYTSPSNPHLWLIEFFVEWFRLIKTNSSGFVTVAGSLRRIRRREN